MNQEIPDVQDEFRKSRGTRDQIANICWIVEKTTSFQKNICFIAYAKAFELWSKTTCGKFLKRWKYQTILPASWETCIKVKEQQLDFTWSKDRLSIGKEVWQDCISSSYLFNIYAEYIMWNARLVESQAGIKIAGRNINNFRYAGDSTLMAESEEELKNLLIRVKEESEKADLKLNIQKIRIMASGPITSWQI